MQFRHVCRASHILGALVLAATIAVTLQAAAQAQQNLPVQKHLPAAQAGRITPPAIRPAERSRALQFLFSVRPDVGWQSDGVYAASNKYPYQPIFEPYTTLEVTIVHALPFNLGRESLVVRQPGWTGARLVVLNGSYAHNKPLWDTVIGVLTSLGVQPAAPSWSVRDIQSTL
jgi:hypothetical protein